MMLTKLSKFYDKQKSEEMIRNRYRRCMPPIRLTLKNLIQTEVFQKLKGSLRSTGWKDWHILLAINNLVMNFRMQELGILNNIDKMVKFGEKWVNHEEQENDIQIPLKEFTKKNLMRVLEASMPATLRLYGFSTLVGKELKIDQIKEFLSKKFNYWNDDVEHDLIFDL